MNSSIRILIALVVLAAGASPLAAANPASITMIPFENASGAPAAPAAIGAHVAKLAAERGWNVNTTDMRPLLEQERVRYFDSLDDDAREKVLAATGGTALFSGTIYTFADGRNPVVAVAARLVAGDGTLLWSQVTAVSADDEESLFGIGRAQDAPSLAGRAVEALMRSFPRPDAGARVPRSRSKPRFLDGVVAYRARSEGPMFSGGGRRRICVLPFEDRSKGSGATQVVHDTLVVRLAADPTFEVVDPAVLRAAARDMRIGSFRGITNDDLLKVGHATGATLFVRGTIYDFIESAGTALDPRIDLEMSIVDVEAERVVWAAQHDRHGSDYSGLFLLGAPSSGIALADRVIAELIAAEPRRAPRAAETFIAARIGRNARKGPVAITRIDPSRKGGEDKK